MVITMFSLVYTSIPGWHFTIYENLVDKKLVENSQRNGYLDYKKLMFGNAASGPLSLHLSVVKLGPVCTLTHLNCIYV